MEPVPCATMPPLSRQSQGVRFGSSTSACDLGEPAEVTEPCPVCGRVIWDVDREQHTRFVYSRAAIEAAQKHAVVAMHEPYQAFPEFDPVHRSFKDLIGLPWLLFSRKALEVIVEYAQARDLGGEAGIQPVFAEE